MLTNPAALPKFIFSVNWAKDEDKKEGLELISKWCAPDPDDAIFLLSRSFAFNAPPNDIPTLQANKNRRHEVVQAIREKAINTFRQLPEGDKRFSRMILQLVASLKYENLTIAAGGSTEDHPLIRLIVSKTKLFPEHASNVYWFMKVESFSAVGEAKKYYELAIHELMAELSAKNAFAESHKRIQDQIFLQETMSKLFVSLKGRDIDAKKKKLKEGLKQNRELMSLCEKGNFFLFRPAQKINGLIPDKSTIFKSNTSPILIKLKC